MRHSLTSVIAAAALFALPISCLAASADFLGRKEKPRNVQVGPRPYYLIEALDEGPLKKTLQQCSEKPLKKTDFTIGHRGGGTLQFPEHTKESHEAGARMGAGIQECDVTFTKDGELVCRHDQCDLHTTTNILTNTTLAPLCTSLSHQPNSMLPAT